MELFIELYRWWWLMPHPIPRDQNKDWVCSVFVWPLCLCSVTAFYHGCRPSLSSTVERWHRRNISIKLCPNYYTSAKHSLEVFPYRMSLCRCRWMALALDSSRGREEKWPEYWWGGGGVCVWRRHTVSGNLWNISIWTRWTWSVNHVHDHHASRRIVLVLCDWLGMGNIKGNYYIIPLSLFQLLLLLLL